MLCYASHKMPRSSRSAHKAPVMQSPGGVLPYMGYMGMCRCEGYGFQPVYSRIGYINPHPEIPKVPPRVQSMQAKIWGVNNKHYTQRK